MQKAAGELNRTVQAVVYIETKTAEKKTEEAIKRIRHMGDLGSQISEATPDPTAEPVTIDQGIIRKLRPLSPGRNRLPPGALPGAPHGGKEQRWFRKKNIMFIEDIQTLPKELMKKTLKII